jgi:hypothetical protein
MSKGKTLEKEIPFSTTKRKIAYFRWHGIPRKKVATRKIWHINT